MQSPSKILRTQCEFEESAQKTLNWADYQDTNNPASVTTPFRNSSLPLTHQQNARPTDSKPGEDSCASFDAPKSEQDKTSSSGGFRMSPQGSLEAPNASVQFSELVPIQGDSSVKSMAGFKFKAFQGVQVINTKDDLEAHDNQRDPASDSTTDSKDGPALNYGSLFEERREFVAKWVWAFFFITLTGVLQSFLLFPYWLRVSRMLMFTIGLSEVIIASILWIYYKRKKSEFLLYAVCSVIFGLFVAKTLQDLEPEQMLRFPEDNGMIYFFASALHSISPLLSVVILQGVLMALDLIETQRTRKRFFVFISLLFMTQLIVPSYNSLKKLEETDWNILGLFMNISAGGVIFFMIFLLFKLKNISSKIFLLERDDANRYKYMVNSIKDLILVENNGKTIFMNKAASKAFRTIGPPGKDGFLQTKLFYLFQNYCENNDESDSYSQSNEGRAQCGRHCSLSELLSMDYRQVNSCIFTTCKEISQSKSVDQLQQVLESRDGKKKGLPLFVSVQLIKVVKEVLEDIYEEGDEVMIQIQDVSHRILGQNLKIERQYMAVMNSTVSHEMRNPLNALLSSVEIQQKRVSELTNFLDNKGLAGECEETTASFSKSLSVSRSSCKLLKFNVEDILALPQIQQGKFTKNVNHANLHRSVDEILQIMEFQVQEKQLDVQVEFCGFDAEDVVLDEQRFQQILLNYFSNAIKFTRKKGRILVQLHFIRQAPSEFIDFKQAEVAWIDLDSSSLNQKVKSEFQTQLKPSESDKILLSVIDNGVGIKDEDQCKLFKLFGRLQATKKINTKGIGLGLAISKMIAEEFEGQVAVQSEFGTGSAFFCSMAVNKGFEAVTTSQSSIQLELSQKLGVVKETQLKEAAKMLKLMEASGEEKALDKRILIIDDEAYNCEILSAIVQAMGINRARFDLCMSGEEAIEKVKQGTAGASCSYAAILTDLSMPFINGYQLASMVRKYLNAEGIPRKEQPLIAAITGHTECEFYTSAFEAGIDQVYSKPLSSQQVSLILTQVGFKVKLTEEVKKRLI